jgi:hypothetical protein
MARTVLIALLILLPVTAKAQINELGIFAGGANYIGDVGPTTYIAPEKAALGILYKWNRSPRHSYRASFTYAKIASNDAESDVSGRQQRGYRFENTLKELSAGIEFSFFDFNLHEPDFKITPYVYTGLSYVWHDEHYFQNGGAYKQESGASLAIPMTVGIKSHIAPSFVLGVEAGARYAFTDNLDGSNPDNASLGFGNLESNDWYVFTGITLTYTFGDTPCYCSE